MRIIKLWLPPLLWAGLIFYLSDLPSLQTGLGFWDIILRKGAHIFEYGVLTLFLFRAFRSSTLWNKDRISFWSGLCGVLYAFSDEIHQAFVPGRGPALSDVGIDTLGVILALWWLNKKVNQVNRVN